MLHYLDSESDNFRSILADLLKTKIENDPAINKAVSDIIADVVERRDEALFDYTRKFDKADFDSSNVQVTQDEIEEAYDTCPLNILDSLIFSAERIEKYHHIQLPENMRYIDDLGVTLGWKWSPIEVAGLYVPGGLAAYPSTVLMNAIPARIAGVPRLVMVVPAPNGKVSKIVLAAAKIAGVEEIYKIGGSQAIAALAYGTETIPAVDKIVGPGNVYVATAKRQVFGKVGIDMIAGPSEIVVISDKYSNPDWIAADLLSQAEHDVNARSILITDNKKFAQSVILSVEKLLKTLDREEITRESWEKNGIVITVNDIKQAADISNMIAPEHLELAVNEPKKLEKRITNAGAIFLGRFTPEAIGDYVAGPSHVLPTAGSSRFSSGLSVFDFLKRSSIISCDQKSFQALSEETQIIAEQEGLDAHALSIITRKV